MREARTPDGDLHRRSGEKSLTIGSSRREDCKFWEFGCRENGMCCCTNSRSPMFRNERVEVVSHDDVTWR
jgi:hypothetical protein